MNHCLIIGSGLGGLSCGALLARHGFAVTVLEQGAQAGGCLQSFVRAGAKFETGMHFVGSADPGQAFRRLLHGFELDELPLERLDPTALAQRCRSLRGIPGELLSGGARRAASLHATR